MVQATPPLPSQEKLITVEAQREFDLLTGGWEERIFVKLYLAARTSGLLREISDRDWKTLCVLATYMNADGFCNPTQAELARALGVSRQMANERVQSLANFRFQGKPVLLVERPQRKANGRWGRNGYQVLPISRLRIFDQDTPPKQSSGTSKKAPPKTKQKQKKPVTVSRKVDTVELTVSSDTVTVGLDTNKKQKDITRQQDVVVVLTNLGIHQDTAKQLTQGFPTERIREKIAFYNFLKNHHPRQVSQNPAGWLVRAIERDYAPPHDFKAKKEPAQTKPESQWEEEAQEYPPLPAEPEPDAPDELIKCWQTAYNELQLQMPRETFDTWLRQAKLVRGQKTKNGAVLTIGVQTVYAREWLEHRLKKIIVPTLSSVAGCLIEARFEVMETKKTHFVRQRRKELGLSQGDLSLRLKHRGFNLSRKAISEWERGKRQVELSKADLEALADALGWSLDQLQDERL